MTDKDLKNAFPTIPQGCYDALMTGADGRQEEPIVKKKISTALAIALALLLLFGVALAVGYFQENARQIAQMEAEHGFFDTWPAAERRTLIEMLVDSGEMERTAQVDKLLTEEMTEREAQSLSLQIMLDWVTVNDRITLLSILQRVWGGMGDWSMERKAWYSTLLEETDTLDTYDMLYRVPEAGYITQEEAFDIIMDEIQKAFDMTDEKAASYVQGYTELYATQAQPDIPLWAIFVEQPGEYGEYLGLFTVRADTGEVVSDGHMSTLPAESAALSKRMQKIDTPLRDTVDAFLAASDIRSVGSFYGWSLTQNAAWSEQIRPLVQDTMQTAPDTLDADYEMDMIVAASTYVYGMPDGDSISPEEAIQVAMRALEANAPAEHPLEKDVGTYDQYLYYDITDPDVPRYRVYFWSYTFHETRETDRLEFNGYRVEITPKDGTAQGVEWVEKGDGDQVDELIKWL